MPDMHCPVIKRDFPGRQVKHLPFLCFSRSSRPIEGTACLRQAREARSGCDRDMIYCRHPNGDQVNRKHNLIVKRIAFHLDNVRSPSHASAKMNLLILRIQYT